MMERASRRFCCCSEWGKTTFVALFFAMESIQHLLCTLKFIIRFESFEPLESFSSLKMIKIV